jgi:ankyrin repeat protein
MQFDIENFSRQFGKTSGKKISEISIDEVATIQQHINEYLDFVNRNYSEEEAKNVLIDSSISKMQANILHVVVKFGDEAQAEKILQLLGSKIVNVRDANLYTPLHYAAFSGRREMAKILIKYGADKNPRSSDATRNWTPIHSAAKVGYLDIVKELLEVGVDKNFRTVFGLTILHIAAENGHSDLVKFLISQGLDKESKTIIENYKMTPLQYAVIGGHKEAAEILLKSGADYNVENALGMNALEIAAAAGYVEIVKLLLAYGCNSQNESLAIAKKNKRYEVARIIEKYQNSVKLIFKKLDLVSSKIISTAKQFDKDNLHEAKMILDDGVSLNAYGIFAARCEFGFFVKKQKSLLQFAEENQLFELSRVLKALFLLAKVDAV